MSLRVVRVGGIVNVIWDRHFSQNRPGFVAIKTIPSFQWLDTIRIYSHLFSLQHACHGHPGTASVITMAGERDKTNRVPTFKSHPTSDACHLNAHLSLGKARHTATTNFRESRATCLSHVRGSRGPWTSLRSSGDYTHVSNLRYPADS